MSAEIDKDSTDRMVRLSELDSELAKEIARLQGVEKALARENQEWGRIFHASSNLIMVLDDQHTILRVNRAMADALGITEQEAVGQKCFELVHGEKEPPDFCPHALLLADGKEHLAEVFEPRLNGTYDVRVFPIQVEDGHVLRSVHVARDITEEKRKEQEIRLQAEFVNNVLDSLTHPFYVVDASDFAIVVANRTAGLGNVTVGQKCYAATHGRTSPCSGPDHPCPVIEVKKTGKPVTVEHVHFHPQGGARHIEVHAYPIMNASGEVSQVIEYALDITQRKRAEDALRESEERFKQVAENAGEWIWEVDAHGMYRYCSSAVERILGYSPHELVGQKHFYDLFAPEVREDRKAAALAAFERRESFRGFVNPNVHKNGSIIILETTGSPIQDEQGALHGYRGTDTDITERKRAEEALERRVIALTRPLDETEGIAFEDLFSLDDIQTLQDQFANAVGVASLITRPDGTPITKPSNFCRLCKEIVRKTEQGQVRCNYSDSLIGGFNPDGPAIQPCLSAGLCNAGTSISVGGRHIANWLIGQVRNEMQDPDSMRTYARTIGADEEAFLKAYYEVPFMPQQQFVNVAQALYTLAGQLSTMAYQNVQQARFIAERKQAEEARIRSENKYRTLFDESRDGVYAVLREGEITDANPSFLEMFGYTKEELIGKNVRQLYVDPADRIIFQEEIEKKGFVKDYELMLRKKDGTPVDCLLTSSVQYGNDGNIIGDRGIVRDLTTRKRLQNQLLQAQKMEAIGTLAGGISHDFNNILQIILACTDLMIMHKGKDSLDLRNLKMIQKATRDARHLIKGLLMFSRQTQSNRRSVNLSQQLKYTRKMLRRMIPRMIEIELTVAQDLKTVNADPVQIGQVLTNLAINAHHAMSKGGKLTIAAKNVTLKEDQCLTIVDSQPGEYVMLEISDTGHGMDKEVLDRIFEPFYTTKGSNEGTGLGLSIVYGIVKNHGGHITCSSEPGQGTTFTIYFPAVPGESMPDMATTSVDITAFGTESILLVDDEEPIRKSIGNILTRCGYTVHTATDCKEALQIYREKKDEIDLAVLDLDMPGMSSELCMEEILRIDPRARIIIASGHSIDECKKRAPMVEAIRFIGKPFDTGEFLRVIQKVLNENVSQENRVSRSGPISAGSAEGAETSRRATYPLADASPVDQAPEIEELPRQLRILAIDDREQYLTMLEAGLTQFGHTVFTASSGIEGLQLFKETPVDVVICDLEMPELDGWEVGRKISEICLEKAIPKTPLVLLTGETDLEQADQVAAVMMADCGVDAIVGKPVDIPDLLKVIERLMNQSEGSDQ